MATNNLSASTTSVSDISNYVKGAVDSFNNMTAEEKSSALSNPAEYLKNAYQNITNKNDSNNSAENTEENKGTDVTYTPREGQDNFYAGQNTVSHADDITTGIDDYTKKYTDAVSAATDSAVKSAEDYEKQSLDAYQKLSDVAKNDYDESIARREAVEANNGNRDGIGHEQYGYLEQAYSQRLGEINDSIEKLKRETVRAVADARAKGDYSQANALLDAAKQKLTYLYTEQTRIDTNMRSNYEWQTKLDEEDKNTALEDKLRDKAWMQSVGETLIKAGIMPSGDILDAMGLDTATARKVVNYAQLSKSSGSGGSGSSSSSGSPDEEPDPPDPPEIPTGRGSVTKITERTYSLMAAGDTAGAQQYATAARDANAIDQSYYESLSGTISSGGSNSAGYQNYLKKNGG